MDRYGVASATGPAVSRSRLVPIMHQLDIDTALIHTDGGFTVRLRTGTTPA
jgi:hypothetical protein